jgi:hypothetical protein
MVRSVAELVRRDGSAGFEKVDDVVHLGFSAAVRGSTKLGERRPRSRLSRAKTSTRDDQEA